MIIIKSCRKTAAFILHSLVTAHLSHQKRFRIVQQSWAMHTRYYESTCLVEHSAIQQQRPCMEVLPRTKSRKIKDFFSGVELVSRDTNVSEYAEKESSAVEQL